MKGQPRIETLKTLATLGTQDTVRRQIKLRHKQNTKQETKEISNTNQTKTLG